MTCERRADRRRRLTEVEHMGRSVVARVAVAVAGSALLVGLVTAPAGAATTRREPPPKSNFAGYTDNTDATTNSVQATFTVPNYTCKKGENLSPGIGAFDDANNGFSSAYMYLACAKIGKKYGPSLGTVAIEIDNGVTYDNLAISAGDAIQFTQSCGPTGTSATIEDLNNSDSFTQSASYASSCEGGYVGDLGVEGKSPKKVAPLPTFGSSDYSAATINGDVLSTSDPTASNYYEGKKAGITTGSLTGGGTAFVLSQVS
jgi:hypothetical protein